jgi:hypothetical protein
MGVKNQPIKQVLKSHKKVTKIALFCREKSPLVEPMHFPTFLASLSAPHPSSINHHPIPLFF